ncbi:MAG: MarR family transcriptional regulator [Shinella sp.]|nr:MarR family transcriptional regulator [Shinella sp.]
MPLPAPDWLATLRDEAAKDGRTKQDIANELGVSRTAISLLCSGKYTAKMDKVARKIAPLVMARYANRVWCPHARASITAAACEGHRTAPMAMSDAVALRQWAACRSCPQNPENQISEVNNAV